MHAARAGTGTVGVRRQIVVAALVVCAVAGCYFFVDRPVAVWAHGLSPRIDRAFRLVTAFGSSTPYLVGSAAAYLLLRFVVHRPPAALRALYLFAAVGLSGLIVNLLKILFGRARPDELFIANPEFGFSFFAYGYRHNSFPSGHSTTVGALAAALSLLYPQWRPLWCSLAVLVALSRVVVGSHFPGDVIAGLWFGAVFTLWLGRARWFGAVVPDAGEQGANPTGG